MYVNYIEKTKYPQENNTKTNSIRDQTTTRQTNST